MGEAAAEAEAAVAEEEESAAGRLVSLDAPNGPARWCTAQGPLAGVEEVARAVEMRAVGTAAETRVSGMAVAAAVELATALAGTAVGEAARGIGRL